MTDRCLDCSVWMQELKAKFQPGAISPMDLFSDQDVKDHLLLEQRYLSAVCLQLFSNTWVLLWHYMVLLWPLWAGQLSAHKISLHWHEASAGRSIQNSDSFENEDSCVQRVTLHAWGIKKELQGIALEAILKKIKSSKCSCTGVASTTYSLTSSHELCYVFPL